MFFIISKILHFLTSPLSWVFIIFVLSFFINKSKAKKLRISAICILYFFSNAFIFDEMARKWEVKSIPVHQVNEHEIGVVLGGFITYSNSSTLEGFHESSDRFLHALTLYKAKKIDKFLISGGSGSILKPHEKEALIIKNFFIKIGVPANDILVEPYSRNTYENAYYSSKILKKYFINHKPILITSAYHMKRAELCFKKQGITPKLFAVDQYAGPRKYEIDHLFIPNSYTLTKWQKFIHEWVGLLVYKIKGYI